MRPLLILAALALTGQALAAEPRPGQTFKDCEACPEMVVIPPGRFTMGSDRGAPEEKPAHPVTIAKPFALSRTEVTFDQWETCRSEGGCAKDPDDHKWGRGSRPVMNLDYAAIRGYLQWLGSKGKRTCRLPSEAEWEYAARGGGGGEYWWGDEIGQGRANCRTCGAPADDHSTLPVATYPANPFGLHDTAGNVWEWTADCWNPNHEGAPADGSPRLTGNCTEPVMKGGAWYYFPRLSRSAYRAKNHVNLNSYTIGFRVLCELP